MTRLMLIAAVGAVSIAGTADAAFVLHDDYQKWSASAGTFDTITFAELPPSTLVTTQYSEMGLMFVDYDGNWTDGTSLVVYPQDGYGLDGEEVIDIHLTKDAYAVAAHFPGILRYRLFLDAALVYDSDLIGGSDYDMFGGVMSSSVLFDRVLLSGQPFGDQIFLDNLYISFAPVPGPSAMMLLAAAPLSCGKRRGCRSR